MMQPVFWTTPEGKTASVSLPVARDGNSVPNGEGQLTTFVPAVGEQKGIGPIDQPPRSQFFTHRFPTADFDAGISKR